MKIRSVMGVAAALCTSAVALAQPANDNCGTATVITTLPFNSGPIDWTTATDDTANNPSCDSTSNTTGANNGVWFVYTPAASATLGLAQTAGQDTATSIWTGTCPTPLVQAACSDPESSTFAFVGGTTYYILVSKWSATAPTGTITFTLSAVGACCSGTGTCTITGAGGCTGTSTYQGDGTVCTPTNPCTAQLRACCSSTGTCSLTMPAGCAGATQTFLSGSTVCTPTNPCTALLNACCSLAGVCSLTTPVGCAAPSSYMPGSTVCTPNPCTAPEACCLNQCCTLLVPSRCALIGGTSQGPATTCTVNPCTTVPANDLCSAAIGTTVGTLIYGSNCGATPLTATEVPAPTCQSSFSRTVWYTVTPATTGLYNVSICGANIDMVLDVFTTPDCVAFTAVACDDDACAGSEIGPIGAGSGLASIITGVQLTGGTTYYLRVSSFGTTNSGFFQLLTSVNTTAGACCNPTTGVCTFTTVGSSACAAGSSFILGVTCNPNPCPQPTGACCTNDGMCSIVGGATCTSGGGLFQGPASVCGPSTTCPVSTGSCCNNTTGVCTFIVTTGTCTGGTFTAGGVCSPNTCPQPGACCVSGCCTVTLQTACTGTWGPANSTCSPNPCGAPANNECTGATPVVVGANPGSNCGATTSFVVTPETQCGTTTGAGGARDVWHSFTPTQSANYTFNTCATPGFDTVLTLYGANTGANACPTAGTDPIRACNDDTAGTCAVSTLRSEIPNQLLVAGQTYYVRVAAWGGGTAEGLYVLNITQGAAAGACCTGTSCAIALGFNCTAPSVYQGDFSTCGPNTCDPLGECCDNGGCTVTTQSGCAGSWTVGGTCTPNNCPQPNGACCCGASCSVTAPAACVGANTSFAGAGSTCLPYSATVPCCRADFNKLGGVSVQDIFDFLAAYFGGCP